MIGKYAWWLKWHAGGNLVHIVEWVTQEYIRRHREEY